MIDDLPIAFVEPEIVGTRPKMSSDDYHADLVHDSSSTLRAFEDSPALYYHKRITKRIKPEPSTPAQLAGQACHTALLEPHRGTELITMIPLQVLGKNGIKSGKAWEEWRDAQPKGAALLKPDEYDTLNWQIECVWKNPRCRELLMAAEPFERELSFFWKDDQGHPCKVRFDLSSKAQLIIGDVKTTRHVDSKFWKSVQEYTTHAQAALYCKGFQVLHGHWPTFKYLLVPADPPFEDCCVRTLPPRFIQAGDYINLITIAGIRACRAGRRPWVREGAHEERELEFPEFMHDQL